MMNVAFQSVDTPMKLNKLDSLGYPVAGGILRQLQDNDDDEYNSDLKIVDLDDIKYVLLRFINHKFTN